MTKAPLKTISLLAALTICSSCALAQTTHMMMPEGSKDIYISVGASYGPRGEGSAEKGLNGGVAVSAQFANGVFIDMNEIGLHLSRKVNMRYGPVFSPQMMRVTRRTASGTETKRIFAPEVGGFFSYSIAHGLGVSSSVMYGGSSDHRGLRTTLGLHTSMPVIEHHAIGARANLSLANRSSLQKDFGVTEEQAGEFGLPQHEVRSGVRSSNLAAWWRWEVSNKFALTTILNRHALHGSAGASPRMERNSGVSLTTVLTYHW